jgi:hypothetical protein
MKNQTGSVTIIGLLVLLIVGASSYFFVNNKDRNIDLHDTDTIFCTATNPSRCLEVKCTNSNIESVDTPAPGSIPYRCSDGSSLEIIEITESDEEMMVGKPAVYLYPTEDVNVSVSLDINGRITKDVPEYNNGWDVFVEEGGLISNRYDYLFYENTLNTIELPEEGWVVAQKDLYSWFDLNLPKLGLNEKEIIQFKEYWLYELLGSPYYEIKLFSNDFLSENMKLSINPEPNSVLRLIFNFKEIEGLQEIKKPVVREFERTGFTVVEWGGRLEK